MYVDHGNMEAYYISLYISQKCYLLSTLYTFASSKHPAFVYQFSKNTISWKICNFNIKKKKKNLKKSRKDIFIILWVLGFHLGHIYLFIYFSPGRFNRN